MLLSLLSYLFFKRKYFVLFFSAFLSGICVFEISSLFENVVRYLFSVLIYWKVYNNLNSIQFSVSSQAKYNIIKIQIKTLTSKCIAQPNKQIKKYIPFPLGLTLANRFSRQIKYVYHMKLQICIRCDANGKRNIVDLISINQ